MSSVMTRSWPGLGKDWLGIEECLSYPRPRFSSRFFVRPRETLALGDLPMPYEYFPAFIRGLYFPDGETHHRFLTDMDAGLCDEDELAIWVAWPLQPKPAAPPAPPPLPDNKLLLTAREAASLCGLGERTWHRMNSEEQCPAPVKLNSSVRWNRDELREWTSAGCPSRDHWERTWSGDCR